jgi:hypothetical protein
VIARSFQILSLVAVLALFVALPVLAEEPPVLTEEPLGTTTEPSVDEFERVNGGGECGSWFFNLIWGARANCPDQGGLLLLLGL